MVVLVLALFLAADATFVALHVLHDPTEGGLLGDDRLRLEWDRGYSEIFGYLQLSGAAGALAAVYRRRREPVYLAWAATLVAVMLDDALTIHERVGNTIAPALPAALGPRRQDGGELIVLVAIGAALALLVVLAHRRSDESARQDSRRLALLMAALVCFVLLADRIQVQLSGDAAVVAGIVEDGGELLVISVIAVYALALLLRRDPPVPRAAPQDPAAARP